MRFGLLRIGLVVVMGMLVISWSTSGIGIRAQQSTAASQPRSIGNDPLNAPDPAQEHMQMQQQAMASSERHKRMVEDSDRLLVLATELKEEVDRSTKNEVSVTAIKKATEIERLAREVKERMKGQ